MDEEIKFRKNKMHSMIASYKNKINHQTNKFLTLEYDEEDEMLIDTKIEDENIYFKEPKPENLQISLSRIRNDDGTSGISNISVDKWEPNLNTFSNDEDLSGQIEKMSLVDENTSKQDENSPIQDETPVKQDLGKRERRKVKNIKKKSLETNKCINEELNRKISEEKSEENSILGELEPNRKRQKKKVSDEDSGVKTFPTESDEKQNPPEIDIDPNDLELKEIVDVASFAFRPVLNSPIMFRCQIKRDANGIDRSLFPVYILYHENTNGKKLFLLAARTRKKTAKSCYIISTDPISLYKGDSSYVGKIKSNIPCTNFKFIGNEGTELASVNYEYNVLGINGPRKLKVDIPKVLKYTLKRNPSDYEHFISKSPVWNEDYRSYMLNFHGRVTQASIKNFQLIRPDNDAEIFLQFGKSGNNTFSLDFCYPFTPAQAFSISLSCFASKLVRE